MHKSFLSFFPIVVLLLCSTPGSATGKVLILSSSNIIVYGVAVTLLFPAIGPWWGTLCAFAAAAGYVALLLPLSRRIR